MTLVTETDDARAPRISGGGRWSAVGHAADPDPTVAVGRAFAALDLPGAPVLIVVFASARFDRRVVAQEIAGLAPRTAVVGCTSRGEISRTGPQDDSVVLIALGGDGLRCTTGAAPIVDGDVRAAAADAARCIDDLDRLASTVMLVLVDGGDIDQDDIVRGAYDTVGPSVPLVGGCACGKVLQHEAFLFHQAAGGEMDVPAGGTVIAAAITSDGPIGIGVAHGFDAHGDPLVVTSGGRNIVATLDEGPALDAYLAHHGETDALFDTPDGFDLFARPRPLGIARRGRIEPRAVVAADPVARTLILGASVPQGGLVWLMRGDVESALTAVDLAADHALAALGDDVPKAALVFDCAARRSVLGDDGMRREVEQFASRVASPIAGFYTFGEVARTSGSTGYHNLTTVLLAFG